MTVLLFVLIPMIVAVIVTILWATGNYTTSWSMTEPSESVGIVGTITTSYTGNNVIDITVPVPNNTVNQETDCYIVGTGVQFLTITSDKDLTLKINSSGTPTDTIVLKGGVPWTWCKGGGIPFPITGTAGVINKIFANNAGVGASFDATLRFRGLQNT